METVDQEQLKRERDRLNELLEEALENGTPICETNRIGEQYKKVQDMIQSVKKDEGEW